MKRTFFFILSLLLSVQLFAAANLRSMSEQEPINRDIYNRVYQAVAPMADQPINVLVAAIAQQFLGTEYVASTLEQEPEQLRIYLDQTDCILFVELSTCFALTVKGYRIVQAGDGIIYNVNPTPSVEKADPSYELLCENIRNMRYRLGVVDGYASRVHYTSEWIFQNQTNGILREYSSELGVTFPQEFYFMSTHQNIYRQLQGNDEETMKIRLVENHLTDQGPYYYIPQSLLRKPEVISQIHTGDIVTFVSKQGNGIDLAHVALAFEYQGKMHFIHASMRAMRVIIEEKTLADYATNGIRVCRLNPAL